MKFMNLVLTRAKNVLPSERLSTARNFLLQKCDFVVDIGAHDGTWISKVKKSGWTGNSLCIEPSQENYKKILSKNLVNTKIMNIAIGNDNKRVNLNYASNRGLSSSLLDMNTYHLDAAPQIQYISKQKVTIKRLSSVLKDYDYRNMYIKIDTQGYELEVLKSIQDRDYHRITALEVESNLVEVYKNAPMLEEIIKHLRLRSFDIYRIENGFGMPNFGQQLQVDVLFIKKSLSK